MRILVIANLPPYVLGGAENQVARLVDAWTVLGHHVEVAGHRIPDGRVELGSAAIRTHRIFVFAGLGRVGRALSYFLSLLLLTLRISQNFDVIYCRGLGDAAISICLLKALGLLRLPLVACPINARGAGDTRFIRSIPGWRRLVGMINRHCDAINIIAPAIERDLSEIGIVQPRLARIPNGIVPSPRGERGSVSSPRRLVWTGRLSLQKGLDVLLIALSRVSAKGHSFRVEIIGDGPERGRLTEQSNRLGLLERVTFLGALPAEAICERLADADLFVLPSRYEGMSNAALEAMDVGLPLILTRCGGIDTYIDPEFGWVCEPDDVDDLENALLTMLEASDATFLQMGQCARTLVEREFAMADIAQRNINLLAEVAASNRA